MYSYSVFHSHECHISLFLPKAKYTACEIDFNNVLQIYDTVNLLFNPWITHDLLTCGRSHMQ